MENVLITGTTSGIGKAFAEKFASMGNNIILVSRDRQKLEQQQLYLQIASMYRTIESNQVQKTKG